MGKVTCGHGAYIEDTRAGGHEGKRDTVQRCKSERSSCAKVQKW